MVDRAGRSGVTDAFQAPAFDALPTESVDAEEVKRALAEIRQEPDRVDPDPAGPTRLWVDERLSRPRAAPPAGSKNRLLMVFGIVLILLAATLVVVAQSTTRTRESIVIQPASQR